MDIMIIFLLFLKIYFSLNSFISLPFTYINNKKGALETFSSNATYYFEYFFDNSIYTTLNVNNNKLKFHVTMNRHATYISEKMLKEIDSKAADPKNEIYNLYSLEYIGILRAAYTTSIFSFMLNSTNISISKNFSLFLAKTKINESDSNNIYNDYNAEIGLNIYKGNKLNKVIVDYDPDDYYYNDFYEYKTNETEKKEKIVWRNNGYNLEQNTNLIYQLKKNKVISSYTFLIKYDNQKDENGHIIIGGFPHEYDQKNYNKQNFIYSTVSFNQDKPNWQITFDDIKYGDESFSNGKIVEFSIDFGFILTSLSNKNYFDKIFFKNSTFSNHCKEEVIRSYFVKYCDEKVIQNFKNLNFYLYTLYNGYNKLELNFKDLFIKSKESSNTYYFQIVFQKDYNKWLFGRPLFKKYSMVFDQNKRIFGFYTKIGEFINDELNDNTFNYAWILVIVLSFCLLIFIIIVVICYFKLVLDKRRKRACELDDYEYISKEDNNKKKEQTQLFKNDL